MRLKMFHAVAYRAEGLHYLVVEHGQVDEDEHNPAFRDVPIEFLLAEEEADVHAQPDQEQDQQQEKELDAHGGIGILIVDDYETNSRKRNLMRTAVSGF